MKRIIGLVLVVLAIVGTVGVIRNSSQGAATPATGNSAYDSGRQAGKKTAPVVLVVMGLVGLWLLLKSDDEMRPAAPQRQAPAARSPSLRAGQNTFASNPALLRLNTGQWLAANSWVLIVSSCFAIAGVVFLFIKLPVAIVLLITAIILIVQKTRQARQKFFMGDVCPGVVLYAEQNLVAVFTNLKAGGNAARPAVKILKQPLRRFTTEPAYDGMRVAAAALYYGRRAAGGVAGFFAGSHQLRGPRPGGNRARAGFNPGTGMAGAGQLPRAGRRRQAGIVSHVGREFRRRRAAG